MAAALAVAAMVAPGTAGAQQGDQAAPAPAAATVTGVADALTRAASTLQALQQHQSALATELATRDAEIATIEQRMTTLQRTSSAAVAAAQQQALASYMRSDAANESRALANAIAQSDMNDVAWSLGVLQVTHDHALNVVRQATTARGSANEDLTAALAQRAAVAAESDRIGPQIAQAQSDLAGAQAALTTTVKRVGATVADGMTTVAYDAYRRAADRLAAENPSCGLRWELLSAIGKTESNHGGGRLDAKGDSVIPIIGIPVGADTDGGVLDLDASRDHAVGPMQFIPSTWRISGADGDGDGDADPNNIFDETVAAGRYLCRAAGSLTLSTRDGVVRAILSYNPNMEYLRVVGARYEALASDVANGWFSSGDLPVPTATAAPGDTADGGHPPVDQPFTPPGTELSTLTVFAEAGLAVQTSGDVAGATCAAPSAVLAGRTGYLRCAPLDAPTSVLDPCVVSPSDPTLVACISDPRQPVRLLRSTTAQPATPASPAPPYLALVLSGGDVCLPAAPAGAPGLPPPAVSARAQGFAGATTTSTSTTTTTAPASTSTSTSTTIVTTTSTSPAPTSTSTPVSPTTATTAAAAATTTTAPAPALAPPTGSAVGYRCASGISVLGQPDQTTPAWGVAITQDGAPNRIVTVATAWS